MKLPHGEKAVVDERKVREDLLSASHPVGRFKARFLGGIGFQVGEWQALIGALRQIAACGDAELVNVGQHGTKYLIREVLTGPGGGSAAVVTVWIVPKADDVPRLVTVYPK